MVRSMSGPTKCIMMAKPAKGTTKPAGLMHGQVHVGPDQMHHTGQTCGRHDQNELAEAAVLARTLTMRCMSDDDVDRANDE